MSAVRVGTEGADRFGNIPGVDNHNGYQPGDTLIGLGGDDTYVLFVYGFPTIFDPPGNPMVTIVEAPGGGFDTVQFSFGQPDSERTFFVLPAGTEMGQVTYKHTLFYSMVGNDLGNVLDISGQIEGIVVADPAFVVEAFGEGADDALFGQWGNIALDGGAGDDVLVVALDYRTGWNRLDAAVEGGAGTDTFHLNPLNYGRPEEPPLPNILLTLGGPGQAQQVTGTAVIRLSGIENIWLEKSGNDTLVGNAGANLLVGGMGADSLVGGAGGDTLLGSSGPTGGRHGEPDVSDLPGSGEIAARRFRFDIGSLLGGDGSDTLDGGSGADRMAGGRVTDLYIVDDAGDLVVEHAGEGTHDTVRTSVGYVLPEHVEHLVMAAGADSATGNAGDNGLHGNGADNTLDGGAGADALSGGRGDDRLDGDEGADTADGGLGADTLDGGTGADSLSGGAGNDTYLLDDPGDRVRETGDDAADEVRTSLAATRMAGGIEALRLLDGAERGVGNGLDNLLLGQDGDNGLDGRDGDDTLAGGDGRDRLTGGAGADAFRLLSAGGDPDRITDFDAALDRIEVSAANFGGGLVAGGALDGRVFEDRLPRDTAGGVFLYETASGRLSWDANGSAAGERVVLAVLDGAPALKAEDLLVIA
jgi:Ca2+-binding RTX toxin-like protein